MTAYPKYLLHDYLPIVNLPSKAGKQPLLLESEIRPIKKDPLPAVLRIEAGGRCRQRGKN